MSDRIDDLLAGELKSWNFGKNEHGIKGYFPLLSKMTLIDKATSISEIVFIFFTPLTIFYFFEIYIIDLDKIKNHKVRFKLE